ncbi:MAG TPA: YidB family protein [Gemmatimonadaceae bacterium]|nr:YidB family protein [Gemmatimonadaceae bacterium]
MTLENTATTAGVVPSIVSDNEKLFPEVLNLVRATPGGVPGLLKMFQDKGLGHVAAALTSRDGTRMISPQQIVHGLGTQQIEALATASRLDAKIVRKELVLVLPHVLEQLASSRNAVKGVAVKA